MEFSYMLFKLVVALIIVFALMVLIFKYANKGINDGFNKKYVKVIDRVQISKDSYIVIIKMGNKGMILATSTGHTEKLEELSEEQISQIEIEKQQAFKKMNNKYEEILEKTKNNAKKALNKIKSKEDNHE